MKPTKQKIKTGLKQEVKKTGYAWMLAVCILLTIITYIPVFNAGFVNWDDGDYVQNNYTIRSLQNIKDIITTPVQGNNHPVTMVSLALNYTLSGNSPVAYHLTNILFHILNVILVFFFIRRLSGGKIWAAFITAVLFGIHPLHVESVAWISERKDVLYTFFFLSALIQYLRYIETGKWKDLTWAFLLFILSVMSKPAAVIFPVVLIAIDYFYKRLGIVKTYIEKLPFLIIAIFMGFLTLHAQSVQGAVGIEKFSLYFRFFFGNYGLLMYLVKTLIPVNLCAFYPYPPINVSLPMVYYLSVIFTAGLFATLIIILKKQKVISFSILFYLINLALVLQFFPVGSAVIADRYTYMPLIGPFFLAGWYFQRWIKLNKGKVPVAGIFLLSAVLILLTIAGNSQAATWKTGATMWDQAIKIAPSSRAYNNRGVLYKKAGDYKAAIYYFSQAAKSNKKETDAYNNRGNVYFNLKQYNQAIEDYNTCLSIDSTRYLAYENRGIAYGALQKYDLSLRDLNHAIKLNPKTQNGYASRALTYKMLNMDNEALNDFYTHLSIVPDSTGDVWNTIGYIYQKSRDYGKSIETFNKAISISQKGLFYYNRAISYHQLDNDQNACDDVKKAQSLGITVNPAFLKLLNCTK